MTKLEPVFQDDRGGSFGLKTRKMPEFMLVFRKADTVSGGHYHRGRIPEKNPEVFFLFEGRAELSWKAADGLKTTLVEAPCRIEIPPDVWHQMRAITDIAFLEEGWLSRDAYEKDTVRCRAGRG